MSVEQATLQPLRHGERMSRLEFERRFDAMVGLKWAELLDGFVHLSPPKRGSADQGSARASINWWLGYFSMSSQFIQGASRGHIRIDGENELQPDVTLRIDASHGGTCKLGLDGVMEGPPELCADVVESADSEIVVAKRKAYARAGIHEWVVWRTSEAALDWFVLSDGRYEALPEDSDGLIRGVVFPGLWLHRTALLNADGPTLLRIAREGLASSDCTAFSERLQQAGGTGH